MNTDEVPLKGVIVPSRAFALPKCLMRYLPARPVPTSHVISALDSDEMMDGRDQ